MKKLILVFILFPFVINAQEVTKNETGKDKLSPSQTQIANTPKEPIYMVNDVLVDKNSVVKLNLDLIDNVKIVKDDPKYPEGLIIISYKKK